MQVKNSKVLVASVLLALGAAGLTGCANADIALTRAKLKCEGKPDNSDKRDCKFGAQAAFDYLNANTTFKSYGINASPAAMARASSAAKNHCDSQTGSRQGADACMDGIRYFAEYMH